MMKPFILNKIIQNYKYTRMPQIKTQILYKELSYTVVGIAFKVQNMLGRYATEKQYGNLFEKKLQENNIIFEREKLISKTGDDINRADFVIDNSVIIELKAKPFIEKADYYQVKRYLEFTNFKLGIIINFRQKYLQPKRIINSKII